MRLQLRAAPPPSSCAQRAPHWVPRPPLPCWAPSGARPRPRVQLRFCGWEAGADSGPQTAFSRASTPRGGCRSPSIPRLLGSPLRIIFPFLQGKDWKRVHSVPSQQTFLRATSRRGRSSPVASAQTPWTARPRPGRVSTRISSHGLRPPAEP